MRKSTKIFLFGLIAFLLIGSGVLLGMIPPLVMGDMIHHHVDFSTVYNSEEYGLDAKQLVLKTVDELHITAFEVPVSHPKAVLVFLSGIHNPSVTAFWARPFVCGRRLCLSSP